MVSYYDSRWRLVAKAHQYLRPDGTLGASCKPDPKKLVVNGEEWIADPDPRHDCPECARHREQERA
jgi:hypothetical protein